MCSMVIWHVVLDQSVYEKTRINPFVAPYRHYPEQIPFLRPTDERTGRIQRSGHCRMCLVTIWLSVSRIVERVNSFGEKWI